MYFDPHTYEATVLPLSSIRSPSTLVLRKDLSLGLKGSMSSPLHTPHHVGSPPAGYGLEMYFATPRFYRDIRDPNRDPHACTASPYSLSSAASLAVTGSVEGFVGFPPPAINVIHHIPHLPGSESLCAWINLRGQCILTPIDFHC